LVVVVVVEVGVTSSLFEAAGLDGGSRMAMRLYW